VDLDSDNDNGNEASREEDHQQDFFKLPQTSLPTVKKIRREGEPYIDYSKSIWTMQNDYLNSLEQIANRKEEVALEKERRRLEGDANRLKKAKEKKRTKQERRSRLC